MLPLSLPNDTTEPLQVLCLGAHSDDIEIGCGGALLSLLDRHQLSVHWHVFSGGRQRAAEARRSATLFLKKAPAADIQLHEFRDGFFPHHAAEIKEVFEGLKLEVRPDIIFTHCRHDLHQDHRVICELTRNTWRDHLILEYEIMKYDADLAAPNVFVPVPPRHLKKKIDILMKVFGTQRNKQWFDGETFTALMRLRGIECNSPTRYAEAFYGRKLTLL